MQSAAAANDDDEWNFSSALPPEAPQLPREHKTVVANTGLKIDMIANRNVDTDPSLSLLFAFSNNTAQPLSELHFQLAVTKVSGPGILLLLICGTHNVCQGYELQLKPQSGRTLEPKQSRGVTQAIKVWQAGNKDKKVEAIKLRWRVAYKVGGEVKQEMGEIPEFSVA